MMPVKTYRLTTKGNRDGNEKAIVDALRKCGCRVWRLDEPFDLLVGWRSALFLLEVKQPGKKLEKKQRTEFEELEGLKYPVFVVHTPEEALEAVGVKYRG